MKAMRLEQLQSMDATSKPLIARDLDVPQPGPREILVHVSACGVCHTELDEIEGRAAPSSLPVIPGHEVVGRVEARGSEARRFDIGARIGVGWISMSCGQCAFCLSGRENLCPEFRATGCDVDGGYAEYMVVNEAYAYAIPDQLSDAEAAPLLCAGAVGYRSLILAEVADGSRIGLTGFGASGHLVIQLARQVYPNSEVFVFARDPGQRELAIELGAVWAGDSEERAPHLLHAIIDTTPVWKPVVSALGNLARGGRLVINAIRKLNVDIDHLTGIRYERDLWLEKEIKSVANVARSDISRMLPIAAAIPIHSTVETYPLSEANNALAELLAGSVRGAKVLIPDSIT